MNYQLSEKLCAALIVKEESGLKTIAEDGEYIFPGGDIYSPTSSYNAPPSPSLSLSAKLNSSGSTTCIVLNAVFMQIKETFKIKLDQVENKFFVI